MTTDYRPGREEERRRWDEYDRELAAFHRNSDKGRTRSRSPAMDDGPVFFLKSIFHVH